MVSAGDGVTVRVGEGVGVGEAEVGVTVGVGVGVAEEGVGVASVDSGAEDSTVGSPLVARVSSWPRHALRDPPRTSAARPTLAARDRARRRTCVRLVNGPSRGSGCVPSLTPSL
ncbi:hypothetical protein GCM10009815_19330 [Nocardioides marmoribigeumensis]